MGVMGSDGYERHSKRVTKSKRWRVLRWEILERDGFACTTCGARGVRLEVDHIDPVRNAPDRAFDPSNLQSLCAPCHTRKTRIECGHPVASKARQKWAELVRTTRRKPSQGGNEHA